MSARATDYATYPGDRNTRLTAAARARKVAAARERMREARALLLEVCQDFEANGYRLTEADRQEWRDVVDLAAPVERALRG